MAATVLYDGDCGICTMAKTWSERLDFFHAMHWMPLQAKAAAEFGIPREDLEREMHFVSGLRQVSGWPAVKQVLYRLPLFWIASALLVWLSVWCALAIALLLCPLANPIGNRLYRLTAENRYRLPGSACKR